MTDFVTKPIPEKMPSPIRVERPWGGFSQYAKNSEVTVSLMVVAAHQRSSLQAHSGRAELWIIFDEGASVQVGDEVLYPHPGDEIWIPANTKHRLSSLGKQVRVLEVAYGNWQQEDIVRFDDDYSRPARGE